MRLASLTALFLAACTGDQFTSNDAGEDTGTPSDTGASDVQVVDGIGPPIDASSACNFAMPFAIIPFDSLNTNADESSLRLTPATLFGVFSSNRAVATANDLYSTSRASNAVDFSSGSLLLSLNSAKEDVDPWISPDALTIYFASNRNGTFDIFKATRTSTSNAFGSPVALGIDTPEDETQPFVASNGDLYFSAIRAANNASFDIYRAAFNGNGFNAPMVLSSVSSTSADDDEPVVTNDGLTMYFASSRTNAQMDIFVATRTSTSNAFGNVKPVYELNDSAMDDRPSWVSSDGCALVFHSNRASTKQGFNIFLAVKPQ